LFPSATCSMRNHANYTFSPTPRRRQCSLQSAPAPSWRNVMPEKVEELLGDGLKFGVKSRYIVQEEPEAGG